MHELRADLVWQAGLCSLINECIYTNKFIELFAVLHSATDDLKMAGTESCLIGDFSQVTVINDSCRKLHKR
jgi:hypothetical protein